MSAGNFILQKVQLALKAYLHGKTYTDIPPEQIYAGIQNAYTEDVDEKEPTKTFPCIECVCKSAGVGQNTVMQGQWEAEATVVVRSTAFDTTDAQHLSRSELVFNDLCTTTIGEDLTSVLVDFTALGVTPTNQSWGIEGSTWVSTFSFTILCCGSDIT